MDKFENPNKIELNNLKENVDNKLENWLDDLEKNLSNGTPDNTVERWLNSLESTEEKMELSNTVEFECPENLDEKEFERQLKGQENGINALTLYDWVQNRQNYLENGRIDTTKEQAKAKDWLYEDLIEEYIKNGDSREVAEDKANKKWLQSDALHAPDQIAGGDPYNIKDWGDAGVNRSIGSQWGGGKAEQLDQYVSNRIKNENLTLEEQKTMKMNIKLEVV